MSKITICIWQIKYVVCISASFEKLHDRTSLTAQVRSDPSSKMIKGMMVVDI